MRADQLDGLVAFVAVARARSFTGAAAQLDVSTQAVSKAIRTLEERLAVRLFNRTTRSVSLNEAGERYAAKVLPAVTELLEAQERLQEFRDRPAGVLRLNLSRPTFTSLLQPALARFHEAFPEIHLDVTFDDAFVDIVEKGFDAGIRLGESVARDMVSVPLSREERTAIVGSPAYFARRKPPQEPDDLQSHDCIRFRMPSTGAIYRWEFVRKGRAIDVEVQGPMTVNDAGAMLAAALEGLGLAYTFESTAAPYLATGRLVSVLHEHCPRFPGFHLYYPSRRQMPAKLRCFIDFWKEERHRG